MSRRLVWFSCGAASAVAAKLAVEKYGDACTVVYCDTMATEHPDNERAGEAAMGGVADIRAVADRVRANLEAGVKEWRAGDVMMAELRFSMAQQELRNLDIILDSPKQPLRKLCLVGDRAPVDPDDADLQPWMTKRHGEDPDGAA